MAAGPGCHIRGPNGGGESEGPRCWWKCMEATHFDQVQKSYILHTVILTNCLLRPKTCVFCSRRLEDMLAPDGPGIIRTFNLV